MINYLIKLGAAAVAERIQRGSTPGAIVGCVTGALIGLATAYGLNSANLFSSNQFAVAIYLILSIFLAICGAFAGAVFGPSPKPKAAEAWIRLTRYNRAGATLAVALFFLAVSCFFAVMKDGGKPEEQMSATAHFGIVVGFAVVFLITTYFALRDVWYVELGQSICVRRLIGSQFYSRHDLQMWGFEIRENEVVQKPFESGRLNCCLQLGDRVLRIEVDARDSAAVVALLKKTTA